MSEKTNGFKRWTDRYKTIILAVVWGMGGAGAGGYGGSFFGADSSYVSESELNTYFEHQFLTKVENIMLKSNSNLKDDFRNELVLAMKDHKQDHAELRVRLRDLESKQ